MITFEDGLDNRTRGVKKPQVARMRKWRNGPIVYIVIGTPYGHIHTTGGNVAFWNSYSGAYKGMKRHCAV